MALLSPMMSLGIFCLLDLTVTENKVLKSANAVVVCLFVLGVLSVFALTLLLNVYTFRIIMSLLRMNEFPQIKCVSEYILSFFTFDG